MNEDVENRPEEDIELNAEEFDAGFNYEFNDEVETNEVVDKPVETEIEETEELTEEEQKELDYTPFLENLSKKIKYKDEEIKIDNLDDVITNYQKGKNYDTLQEKLNNVENGEVMQYIKELAKENGMTPEEYIKSAREFNKQQEIQQEQEELNEMINNGVPEHIAKKVIETNKTAKELKAEQLRIAKEKEEKQVEEKKQAEITEFLEKFPNVKVDEIPKEVLENAKKTNLKIAYTEHLLDLREKELQAIKQEKEIKSKSPVKGVTTHGGVVKEKTDPFVDGFDSEF